MPRLLKFVFIFCLTLIVALALAAGAGVMYLRNLDVMTLKPQIVQAAAQALGRPVDFQAAALHVIWPEGVHLQMEGLTIADDSASGGGTFLEVGEADARLDLLPLLTRRQIVLAEVTIRQVWLHIVRRSNGDLNLSSLGKKPPVLPSGDSPRGHPGAPAEPAAPPVAKPSPAAAPPVLIRFLSVEEAQVRFTDASVQPPADIALSHLNLTINGFSLTDPFTVHADGALVSDEKNFRLDGMFQIRLPEQAVSVSDLTVNTDLKAFDWRPLRALPPLKDVSFPSTLRGVVTAVLHAGRISKKGFDPEGLDITIHDGELDAPQMAPGIALTARDVELKVKNFNPKSADAFHVELTAALYQDQPNIDFSGEVAFDAAGGMVTVRDALLKTNFADWPLPVVTKAITPLQDWPLPDRLAGAWQAEIRRLKVSRQGLEDLVLDAKWDAGTVTVSKGVPGPPLTLEKIDLAVNDFSLNTPFLLSLRAAYLSPEPNMSFEGHIQYHPATGALAVTEAVSNLDLDHLPLEGLKASGLIPAAIVLPERWGGKLHTVMDALEVSSAGVQKVKADAQWDAGHVVFPEIVPGISISAEQIQFRVSDFSLTAPFDVALSLGWEHPTPNLSLRGRVSLNPASGETRLTGAVFDAELGEIPWDRLKTTLAPLKEAPLPAALAGHLEVQVHDLTAGRRGVTALQADFALSDGAMRLDPAVSGVAFEAAKVHALARGVSLKAPFDVDLRMAYLYPQQNIHARGRVTLRDSAVTLQDALLETDLETWDWTQVKSAFPALKEVALPEMTRGHVVLGLSEMTFGTRERPRFDGRFTLTDWALKPPGLAVPLSGDALRLTMSERNADLEPADIRLGSGGMALKGTVRNVLTTRDFICEAQMTGLQLAEILDQEKAQVRMEGQVDGVFKAQGRATDISTITGYANMEATRTKLRNINILRSVLEKMIFLPDAVPRLQASLPEEYRALLEAEDTDIEKVTLVGAITGEGIVWDPIQIEAKTFALSGKGRTGWDQRYAVDGAFKIPLEFSRVMADGVAELQYLYDAAQQISLPVHITGRGAEQPVPEVLQTALDVTKGALRNEGKRQLRKLLDDALGVDTVPEPEPSSGETPPPEAGTPSQQPSVGDKIIDGIFDTIFH